MSGNIVLRILYCVSYLLLHNRSPLTQHLKATPFICSQFCRSEISMARVGSCSGHLETEIKALVRLTSCLQALGEICCEFNGRLKRNVKDVW